jgi:hypothetical protein
MVDWQPHWSSLRHLQRHIYPQPSVVVPMPTFYTLAIVAALTGFVLASPTNDLAVSAENATAGVANAISRLEQSHEGIAKAISREALPDVRRVSDSNDSTERELTSNTFQDSNTPANVAREANEMQDARRKESEMTALKAREVFLHSIHALHTRKNELAADHNAVQSVYDEVVRQKEFALLRRHATHDARELALELLRDSESRLAGVQRELPIFRKTVNDLSMQALLKSQDISKLRRKQEKLQRQKTYLVNLFVQKGLGHWAETVLRRRVNNVVSDALLEGSKLVANPVIEGIEKATDLENLLAEEIEAHIQKPSPFYTGLITAFVSLFPAVVIASICLKVKRSLSQLSIRHLALLGCVYFAILSTLCLAATTVTDIDVLVHLRQSSRALYDFAIIVHGIVYGVFTMTHIATAIADGKAKSFSLSLSLVGIGVHFFSHSTAHLRRGESPHVDAVVYILYIIAFFAAAHQIVWNSYQQQRKTMQTYRPMTQRAVRLGGDPYIAGDNAMLASDYQKRDALRDDSVGHQAWTERKSETGNRFAEDNAMLNATDV